MHSSAMKLSLLSLVATSAFAMPAKVLKPRDGGKRGIPYNDPNLTNLFGDKITWAYNWDSTSGSIRSGLDYCPMLFDNKNGHPEAFPGGLQTSRDAGSTQILGFNEPDQSGQADMTVDDAVSLWNSEIQQYAGQLTLISPAVTNGPAPMGLDWLSRFITACTGCEIDAIALHWYDSATNIDYFKNYLTDANTQFGKPIWLTEFGASGSDDEINAFFQEVLPWLDSQSFIERYSYFYAAEGYLVSNGQLSSIGNTYNTV